MKWKLKNVKQETEHPFLNYYTLSYDIEENGETRDYTYYMASRKGKDSLRPVTHSYSLPDGVYIALYYEDPSTHEISIMLTRQYRPAMGTYITSMPAGLIDEGETDIFEVAKREALEEGGVYTDNFELLSPSAPTSSGLSDEMNATVLGRIVGFDKQRLEDSEDITATLVPLKDIEQWLNDPEKLFAVNARLIILYLMARFRLEGKF